MSEEPGVEISLNFSGEKPRRVFVHLNTAGEIPAVVDEAILEFSPETEEENVVLAPRAIRNQSPDDPQPA